MSLSIGEQTHYKAAHAAFKEARRKRAKARKLARQRVGGLLDRRAEIIFAAARHKMMVALKEFEKGDDSARDRKARYMRALRILSRFTHDDVLYYTEGSRVHLFYGGTVSPTGHGESPDGRGHGHVILTARDGGKEGYVISYHRKPVR